MHYSILPVDMNMDLDVIYEEITYKDQLVLVKIIDGVQILERLYSTNPLDFLNPELQPGTILQNPLINLTERCYNE